MHKMTSILTRQFELNCCVKGLTITAKLFAGRCHRHICSMNECEPWKVTSLLARAIMQ